MAEDVLLKEVTDGIARLTLNRPEVMNSFNFALLRAMAGEIQAIDFDPHVRVVIITGGPGTGKTTLIRAITAVLEGSGQAVVGGWRTT